MAVFITGDPHGDYAGLIKWCNAQNLDSRDTVILLGDLGLNWNLDWNDYHRKSNLMKKTKCNFFAIRGNHDVRAEDAIFMSYPMGWNKPWPAPVGRYEKFFDEYVLVEDKFPRIKYAIDGHIYNICGKDCMVIGGGYSVDKFMRLENDWKWVPNEQLSADEMLEIEKVYNRNNVDIILSHVAPTGFEGYIRHTFAGVDKGWVDIDKSMEMWMNHLLWCGNNDLEKWYFGHYHANVNAGPIGVMLFEAVIPFGDKAPDVFDANNCRERKY